MAEIDRSGKRTVPLFRAIESMGIKLEAIELRAVTLDDVIGWHEGKFGSVFAFLADISEQRVDLIRKLTFPDAQIVLDEFVAHVPTPIREQVRAGVVPLPAAGVDQAPGERAAELPDEEDGDPGIDLRDGGDQ